MEFDYIDIHSHLYFPDFDKDREEEINKLKENKIATITVGVDFETSQKAIDLAKLHENLFASVGQHPGDITVGSVFDEQLIALAESPKVVAIGECGLDYYRIPPERSEVNKLHKASATTELKSFQKQIFQSHIDLSLKLKKPLMLHIRPQNKTMDAYEDALEILENQAKISGSNLKGNVHFFVGNLEILKRFLEIGFTVSFPGVITFARDYDETVKYVPLDMVMSETDTPFVAPLPYRGQRNSPMYVIEVVKKIAELKNMDLDKVKIALRDTAIRQFLSIAP